MACFTSHVNLIAFLREGRQLLLPIQRGKGMFEMLFLVETEFDISHVPGSIPEMVALGETFLLPSLEIMVNLEKEKKIIAGGIHAGGHTGTAIFDVDSIEELTRLLQSMPWWNLSNVKVTPLESTEYRLSLVRRRVELAKQVLGK